jgi:hypothetical protein
MTSTPVAEDALQQADVGEAGDVVEPSVWSERRLAIINGRVAFWVAAESGPVQPLAAIDADAIHAPCPFVPARATAVPWTAAPMWKSRTGSTG